MKFILFVEGETEQKVLPNFFKSWLDPKLKSPVGFKIVKFEGWADLEKKAPRKAEMYLNSKEKDKIIAVISLMDLYGPTFYPDHVKAAPERYKRGKEHMEKRVKNSKFHQFFAVHELEAWLLSQPEHFPQKVKEKLEKIENPETVNFNEPPAKLLKRLYSSQTKYSYKKTTTGSDLFKKLDPEIAYQKCRKLEKLLDTMLALAETAQKSAA